MMKRSWIGNLKHLNHSTREHVLRCGRIADLEAEYPDAIQATKHFNITTSVVFALV